MYRLERTVAFLIDTIPMAVFTAIISVFVFPELSGLSFRILAPASFEISNTVSSIIFAYPIYNFLWMYFVFTGIFFKGSIGKRIMKLRLENKKGSLKITDLIKRYSPLIIAGTLFTGVTMIPLHFKETLDLKQWEIILNSYFILVPIYFILCNLTNDGSFYDKLAGTKLTKEEQNQALQTTSASARRLS